MNNALFVRNLSWSVTEPQLHALFETVGTIQSVSIPKDRETNRPKGFAFVTMDSVESATRAIQQLNGTPMGDRELIIDYQDQSKSRSRDNDRSGADAGPSSGLFIKGLPYNADDRSLGDWLSAAGNVTSVSIPTDRETGDIRGFAFIEMATQQDAAQAIQQLNGQLYQGASLQIRYKNPKPEGGGGRDFGGRGSRPSYSDRRY